MNVRKLFLLLIALVAWFGIVTQLVVQQLYTHETLLVSLTNFFSYYTILTNLLVAIFATASLMAVPGFFSRPAVQTGITYHIVIVGLVFNLLLRRLWPSAGMQAVCNDVLHTATPLLMLFYWWKWTDAREMRPVAFFSWLLYPAIYTVYSMIRGAIVHWYPYFFFDVDRFGYPRVLVYCAGLLTGFLILGWGFLSLAKRKPPC
jgi:hypothetical protein